MNFIRAKQEDWKILLEWRNDEKTRNNSINTSIISEAEHKNWFFASLNNPNRIIYIVEENNQKIGTVRVDKQADETYISWTVAPEYRGKGYGKQMVKSW